jgi:hypothetical protein
MPLFALTLSPTLRANLLVGVQGLFILFALVSFVCVAVYTAKKIRAGKFLSPANAPLPFVLPHLVGWLFVSSVLLLIFLKTPLYALLVLMGMLGLLMENGRTVDKQLGFDRMKPGRALSRALLVFGAVMLVETPLTQVSTWILDACQVPHPEQEAVESFRADNQLDTILWFMFSAVLLSPMIEELFFRGYLLTFLKNYTSTGLAIVLSAGVFGAVHLNLAAFIPLWFLGIVLGLAYEHTGSLLVPLGVHACFNLATALSLLMDKGSPT